MVLDSGEAGTVVKVGVRSTTLLTRDEVLVTVPNSVSNVARITTESAPQRRKRIRVPVGVAYGTDLDAFEACVVDLAGAESLVLDTTKPRMHLRRFGDSALEYELLYWVGSPTRTAKATHRLNRAIYGALTAEGIEIPYPKRDGTVRDADGEARTAVADADADADDSSVAPDLSLGPDPDLDSGTDPDAATPRRRTAAGTRTGPPRSDRAGRSARLDRPWTSRHRSSAPVASSDAAGRQQGSPASDSDSDPPVERSRRDADAPKKRCRFCGTRYSAVGLRVTGDARSVSAARSISSTSNSTGGVAYSSPR